MFSDFHVLLWTVLSPCLLTVLFEGAFKCKGHTLLLFYWYRAKKNFFFSFQLLGNFWPTVVFEQMLFFCVHTPITASRTPPLKFESPICWTIILAWSLILTVEIGNPFSLCLQIHFFKICLLISEKQLPHHIELFSV